MTAFSSPATWSRKQLRAERVRVSMPVKIVTLSTYRFPDLADISVSGVKIKGDDLPPKGTTAILKAGSLEVLCRVARIDGNECGLSSRAGASSGRQADPT